MDRLFLESIGCKLESYRQGSDETLLSSHYRLYAIVKAYRVITHNQSIANGQAQSILVLIYDTLFAQLHFHFFMFHSRALYLVTNSSFFLVITFNCISNIGRI